MLEVVIALGLVGMLAGTIFGVARSSMQLSRIVVDEQNTTMERKAFFNLLSHHFEKIPGNAVLHLESVNSGGGGVSRNLFTLTMQNVPLSFNWGETPMTAEAIQLATIQQRDGFVDVVLRFYDEEILQDSDSTGNDDVEPVAEITLVEDLWMCDCEVVDGNTMEQFAEWDTSGKLPLQVKFYCRFEPTSDIVQQTFWIVPKQNPEVLFRQIMQQNPAGVRTITISEPITYGQFASRYGVSITQLNELNGLSLSKDTTLAKGSQLYVPMPTGRGNQSEAQSDPKRSGESQ